MTALLSLHLAYKLVMSVAVILIVLHLLVVLLMPLRFTNFIFFNYTLLYLPIWLFFNHFELCSTCVKTQIRPRQVQGFCFSVALVFGLLLLILSPQALIVGFAVSEVVTALTADNWIVEQGAGDLLLLDPSDCLAMSNDRALVPASRLQARDERRGDPDRSTSSRSSADAPPLY